MRFPHNAKIFRGQLDAAPFLGVFFLVIIFLLLNSAFVFTPGVPIQLPEGEDLPGTDKPTMVVAVDKTGTYYFENQKCDDEAQLTQRLRAARDRNQEPVTLIVQMDLEAKSAEYVRLATIARNLGFREMVQAVRLPAVPVTAMAPVAPPAK